jgi:hypothetical protein
VRSPLGVNTGHSTHCGAVVARTSIVPAIDLPSRKSETRMEGGGGKSPYAEQIGEIAAAAHNAV